MTDDESIGLVLVDEGGLVDNPADPGGITNYGITIPAYTDFLRARTGNRTARATPEDIHALTEPNARDFYRWFMGSTGIARIPNDDVRYVVFDAAVNMGARPAIRLLQLAVGLPADGVIGPATIASIPYRDGVKLARLVCIEQMQFYGRLAAGDLTDSDRDGTPDRLEFLPGWLKRLARKMRRYA